VGQRWVVVPGTVRAIAEVDAGVAERIFGSTDAIVLGGWPGATTGRAWASYAQFADEVETGSIPKDVRVAMYDPENWEPTPLAERLDPLGSIEAFCALARSNGYFVLITPHANLVSVPNSIHAPRAGETREEAFLRSGIVEVSAANADAVETQPQKMQRDPPAYDFRRAAHRAAHVVIPQDAFAAMDYHLSWLQAALVLLNGTDPSNAASGLPLDGDGSDGPMGAPFVWNIEDVDLLVAFAEGAGYKVVMFEAKGYTEWDKAQLISKVTRLRSMFGDDGRRFPDVEPHLIFVSPGHPPVDGVPWAPWMLDGADGKPYHLPLPQPVEQKLEITRGASKGATWWVRSSAWPVSSEKRLNPRLPE
jgi:hypothetical protein